MMKSLAVLSALAVVFAEDYDFSNHLVDFKRSPYQRISLPYSNRDLTGNTLMNIRSKPIKNAIVMNNGYEGIMAPASLIQLEEVNKSLSSIQTSFIAKISAIATTLLFGLKTALKLLITKIPAIIFGAILMIGFCKITSLCSKIINIQSFSEVIQEVALFVTAEKLNIASEFIQDVIRRYRSLQDN